VSYPDDNIHFLGFPLTPETRICPAQGCSLKKTPSGLFIKKPLRAVYSIRAVYSLRAVH
jgi:hypothetical protein